MGWGNYSNPRNGKTGAIGQLGKSVPDDLLLDYTRGFTFDESLREQLNYEQMIALSETVLGWAHDERIEPERSAWLVGFSEGLVTEAERLGPDWNPPEPEKLSMLGYLGRLANGDKVRPDQTPRGRWELGLEE